MASLSAAPIPVFYCPGLYMASSFPTPCDLSLQASTVSPCLNSASLKFMCPNPSSWIGYFQVYSLSLPGLSSQTSFLSLLLYLLICSSAMTLNAVTMLMTGKFLSPAWTCPLNSRLTYTLSYSTSPLSISPRNLKLLPHMDHLISPL